MFPKFISNQGVFRKIEVQFFEVLLTVTTMPSVKVQNFQNPELKKFKFSNSQYAYKILALSSLNGQLFQDKLKINQRFCGWLSMLEIEILLLLIQCQWTLTSMPRISLKILKSSKVFKTFTHSILMHLLMQRDISLNVKKLWQITLG